MRNEVKWVLVISGGVVVGCVILAALVAIVVLLARPAGPGAVGPRTGRFESNDEMIYFSGVNARGERIPFTAGPRWLYMHGGGCVACHEQDGRGGRSVMMGTAIPPDIRYHHLTEEEHGEGEEHPPYTDELIRLAITEGLDPTMPRWQMSEQDLDDLLTFLRTLG